MLRDGSRNPHGFLSPDEVTRLTAAWREGCESGSSARCVGHRAPANCGPTASGIKSLDGWLASAPGGEKWEVIHFNFGIHDRNTPVDDYGARLEQIVDRLEKTGAKLVWATTTLIPGVPARKQTAVSIVERMMAAAGVMRKHGVAIDDLFAFITPRLAEAQLLNNVRFKAEGYVLLGQQVAESIRAVLK